MPLMETVTIINKSGKVVSTGKHLVNIFKDAKEAYNEKKDTLRAEHQARIAYKSNQKLLNAREETRSVASSHRSHRSHRSRSSHHKKDELRDSRPPLTERNLSHISEGSVASSHRSRSSHHGSRAPRSPTSPRGYRAPYIEGTEFSRPDLTRRHTDFDAIQPTNHSQLSRIPPRALPRSASNPDFHDHHGEHIDMNLAYGELPPPLPLTARPDTRKEQELQATMSKLDNLLIEAHCLQHSATAIITNLQANPEAMAAVALTLAEISNLLAKMSPGILTALKTSSPAIFALLASPQFLIAGGVAIGVTVVMFGGYKIIKKIQANNEARKEANRMDEAMVYDGAEMGSIDHWRRGIAEAEVQSVGTSVDGEFITPEAARQKKERIRERAAEERWSREVGMGSQADTLSVSGRSMRSEKTVRRVGSDSTIRRKDVPRSSSSMIPPPSESGRSARSSKREGVGKEIISAKEKKPKKSSTLSVIFKKNKDKKEKEEKRSSSLSHRPKIIEL